MWSNMVKCSYGWLLLKSYIANFIKKHQWRAWEYHKLTNSAQLTVCISSLLFEGRARERSSSWDPLFFLFIPVIMEYILVNLFANGALLLPAMDSSHLFPKKTKKKKRSLQIQQILLFRVPLMQQHTSLNPWGLIVKVKIVGMGMNSLNGNQFG